ncbi:tRNA and rRNA cytosine-C5-methylase [Alcanivorax hongdengensis A-11-3]|uniref:16S rRNA (cytosine(967)-C(5))-methyltransferase n=1 Tax=Alcanivorax hongdengensis A-11-3 TaxID=1177179 RepID=L0WBZ3_9GAMM|nr:16S rRNA (cytosine(967)-C(5))-methyltransferase RsmB [Alcanivorax hongdengensis]EKF74298.1 tRNA and rRNA cytosine-C5-methylase [Alcanivorax hongdengensis A-11-3]
MATPDPRLTAVRVLNRVLPGQGDGESLREVLRDFPLEGADGGLMRDLCFGVCRYLRPLNHWLNQQLDKPLKPSVQPLRLALLAGLYELWFSERPAHAVVNAYPDLCRKLKAGWASGLSNAILRKASRLSADQALADLPPAIRFSLPGWLWKQWQQDWPEQAEALAEASLQPPPFTLRVNRQQHHREALLAQLPEARPGRLTPFSLYLPPRPVNQLPGFADGALSVQDEAAQLPAELLQCPADGRILDACAAPGGKTGQLAERFPEAQLVALELEDKRLARVAENLQRLGHQATLMQGDASQPQSWWDGTPFDAILLDAPCSATGILRRQPDVRWHRKRSDLTALADLQARMLDALWPLLKPGGMLVYATCSVLRQENDRQVEAFLARQPDAQDVTPRPEEATMVAAGWQLFPRAQGPDGFYVACLQKAWGAR